MARQDNPFAVGSLDPFKKLKTGKAGQFLPELSCSFAMHTNTCHAEILDTFSTKRSTSYRVLNADKLMRTVPLSSVPALR